MFSENGNVYNWTEKLDVLNKNDKRYVHAVTVNVVEKLTREKLPSYRFNLLAKNYEGVLELNRLVGQSFKGRGEGVEDPHFYFEPRISINELIKTSENLYVIAEPIDNPIWKTKYANHIEEQKRWLDKLKQVNNLWLSVSSLNSGEQKFAYKAITEASDMLGVGMLYMDVVYSHTEDYERARHILNMSKSKKGFEYESDESQRYLKDYDTVLKNLTDLAGSEIAALLINNTNRVYNTIKPFQLDNSIKYPHISEDSIGDIKKYIKEGVIDRGLHLLSSDEWEVYKERVNNELDVMIRTDAVDYLLLERLIKSDVAKEGIYAGPGRGSVGGSLIAYLLHITDVDPIKHNLLFERFINEDRIDVQDIDSDYAPLERERVQQYLLEHDKFTCASIITFGTLATKAAFKTVGRALDYDPSDMNFATKEFFFNDGKHVVPSSVKEKYPDIIEYAEMVEGVIMSVGRHAAAVIVSDRDLYSEIGCVKFNDFEYDISFIDMDQVSRLKYVKLDVLGLRNLEHIHLATNLAKLPRMHTSSEYINYNDWNIANDIGENGADTLFQLDSDGTQLQAIKLFSKETLAKIHENYPNITIIELLSILTAVIRPGSASIMEYVVTGVTRDNGIPELNEILKDSYGWMIYQEQSIAYLKFVGYSGSEADTIRRAIGKKDKVVIDETVPEIRERSIANIKENHQLNEEQIVDIVDSFMQIFLDSAMYSFNKSHAVEYSYITYMTAWLRYYYPLEWITAGLITWSDRADKVNDMTALAKKKGILIESVKFRYSKGNYFFNKDTNTIYQGTAPIKGNNASTGDMLYETFKDEKFNSFTSLLLRLKEDKYFDLDNKTLSLESLYLSMCDEELKDIDKRLKQADDTVSVKQIKHVNINRTQMLSLIRLDYFSEFGGAKTLERIWEKFDKEYNPNNKTYSNKSKKFKSLLEFEKNIDDEENTTFDQCAYELLYLDRVDHRDEELDPKFAFVTRILNERKSYVQAEVHIVNRGKTITTKIGTKLYAKLKFKEGDIIQIDKAIAKPKKTKVDGVWGDHPTAKEFWIELGKTITRSKGN